MINKQCQCCGYEPDNTDIEATNYHLELCDCGKWVCDLCLIYKPTGEVGCFDCRAIVGIRPGANRKFWLAEEYNSSPIKKGVEII